MKRFARSVLGVTLLEIMLVLAIAAMIIVMSVRYYQSASSSQQANQFISQVQAIAAAADNLAQPTGSYASINDATIGPLLPGGTTTGLNVPWGGSISIASTASTYTLTVSPAMPTAVCPLVQSRLVLNNHYTVPSCSTITYTANP